ncbi:Insect cuticle protein [Trinorchestia longiramus]|nr:Insect cuticle protein [Trinorchestia longiramus]
MNFQTQLAAVILLGVVATTMAGYGHDVHHAPAHYSFKYGVQDPYKKLDFGHQEHRDGYNTKGSYYVHLPDGRIQKVKYTADKHGYQAHVSYDGYAHHDHGHGYH